ncbi:NB-ARC domain containing protein, partial [Parasponia andersonii]
NTSNMAEVVVAGALLSAAFETLFRRLTSPELMTFIRGKKSIDDDQLKELNIKLRRASVLLNDAEERQLQEPAVWEWLDDLKDVIYKAQDLMDDIDDDARFKKERKFKTNMSFRKKMKYKIISSIPKSDKTVKGEIAKILKDLNLLLENEVGRGLKVEDVHENSTTIGGSLKRQPAPWPHERQVHGRNADKEKIMELLLSNDVWGGKIGVLPIVGMGGLGKTTLAQLVYGDSRLKEHHFELIAWVTVSTDFDIFRIMKIILKQVSPGSRHDSEEPTASQLALNEALKDKKFLIVLNDIWDEDYNS